ncbi:nuclease-related domain-containing protein [Acinetobacter corruptisaponis]|uniref:Nuclease-related domain-containing protein n=1 Tax=Acinetobacter corruptisaponis TaxID=3045147 RepID=A0ABY8S2S8_9GAMM|nr:nuclease-related domain-containing protein [Acinetobacter sp. KCTC 92772]WHP05224.1 nuclease-related domain-containing protein [Acinetobacter sp. KCTC 92772]
MFFYIIFFIIVIVALAYLTSPKFKGKMGEMMVIGHAEKLGEEYVLLNNYTLPDGEQGTTQVDHILISPYGVFIIETKNYTGWIFGNARQKQWTQKIYKKSYKFQNPLHQNYKHSKVLEAILADILEPQYLHSVIVFTPRCEFKTEMPENVLRGKVWLDYVKGFRDEAISPMKQKRIRYRIEKEVLEPSWRTDRQHVEHLKQKHLNQS